MRGRTLQCIQLALDAIQPGFHGVLLASVPLAQALVQDPIQKPLIRHSRFFRHFAEHLDAVEIDIEGNLDTLRACHLGTQSASSS